MSLKTEFEGGLLGSVLDRFSSTEKSLKVMPRGPLFLFVHL